MPFIKKPPYHKKVYIAKSPIHGYGIFAKKSIRKGETVYRILGKPVHFVVTNKKTAQMGADWFGIGENTWRDPGEGIGKYQNHSSNPSCGIKGSVTVCAMRDIKPGEEITIDYSTIEAEPLWAMIDTTANGKDRRMIRSIQFLDNKVFKKYLPYIPRYFQRVYYKYHRRINK